jgi:predicted metal-dependent phosphoesterase TrpH
MVTKFDLHTHSYYSKDAICSPGELVKGAKKKGLDGLSITDHTTTRAWNEIRKAGKKHGVRIILGEEIKVSHEGSSIGEVIGLFMNEAVEPGEFKDVRDAVKRQGALLVMAHPFDYFRNRFKMAERFKKDFDAIEGLNSRVVLNWFNDKAMEFAKANRIPVTAGSDAHCIYELANAYTLADVTSEEGLRKEIEKGKTEVWGTRTNPLIHALSTLTKLGFLRKGI